MLVRHRVAGRGLYLQNYEELEKKSVFIPYRIESLYLTPPPVHQTQFQRFSGVTDGAIFVVLKEAILLQINNMFENRTRISTSV